MTHDCCEVPAGGTAADSAFAHIEVQERGSGAREPEEGFPGIVDCGGVGVFGRESTIYQLSSVRYLL